MTAMPDPRPAGMSVRTKAVPTTVDDPIVFVTKVRTTPVKLGKGHKHKSRLKALRESRAMKVPFEALVTRSSDADAHEESD